MALLVAGAIITGAALAIGLSILMWGKDNPVEKEIEDVAIEAVEYELKLPPEPLKGVNEAQQ